MSLVEAVAGRRTILVPEVIQTSENDCGPASIASLLAGFDIRTSYAHLRDVCGTDIDGTSIDDLEDLAIDHGLDAHQTIVPVEHVHRKDAGILPVIAVQSLPTGQAHFVVIWRRLGPWLQVMDPATGRRWIHHRALRKTLLVHQTVLAADDWRAWAGTHAFIGPLSDRMLAAGLPRATIAQLLGQALADESWRSLATLDAVARLLEMTVERRGHEAGRSLRATIVEEAKRTPLTEQMKWLPSHLFTARQDVLGPDSQPMLQVCGTVVVSAGGRGESAAGIEGASRSTVVLCGVQRSVLPQLLAYLRADGLLSPVVLLVTAMVAASLATFEAILFKGLLELARIVYAGEQRLVAIVIVAVFAVAALVINLQLAQGLRMLGRRMEARLRVDFLRALVQLPDSYFVRRLTSDLTLRIHSVIETRGVPLVGESIIRSAFSMLFITAGMIWIDPRCTPYALLAAAVALGLPMAFHTALSEMQLSVATYRGGLSRYLLDALRGALPLRTHAADRSLRRGHEEVLDAWAEARRKLIRTSVLVDTLIMGTGLAMTAAILHVHLSGSADGSSALLLLYWAQQLPDLGRALGYNMMEYPARRAAAARVLEPINANEGVASTPAATALGGPTSRGHKISLQNVDLQMGRARILEDLNISIEPGQHCAVVGTSGAGKSSLLGLLLGWHDPSAGRVEVDGRVVSGDDGARLRESTAWIDPQVQLWNRSLLYNLQYGPQSGRDDLQAVIAVAGLQPIVERLADGLATPLGEGGALLSQGEGQRVRIGRALRHRDARLVLLDEPFRGLDRPTRRQMMNAVRQWWPHSTIICVTHNLSDTLDLDRILVLEGGRITEDGRPRDLLRSPGSRYRKMVSADQEIRRFFDDDRQWRRWTLSDGRLTEGALASAPAHGSPTEPAPRPVGLPKGG